MNSTFSHSTHEPILKEPGTGGKPPQDERPTGGGGGGGDDDWMPGRRGPRDLMHRVRFQLFFLLFADLILFGALLAVALGRQSGIPVEDAIGHFLPLPRILFLTTVALLLSSLTMEVARRNIFREIDVLEEWLGLGNPAMRRARPWVGATLALGLIFLAGMSYCWKRLAAQSHAEPAYAHAAMLYRLFTGVHALHLAIGVLALLGCLTALGWLKRVELRQIAVDATAWYWQSICLAWVLLLTYLAVG
jgi:cytochrome c oxidase subunit 3